MELQDWSRVDTKRETVHIVTKGFTAGQERNQHSVLRMVVKQHKIWKLTKKLTEK